MKQFNRIMESTQNYCKKKLAEDVKLRKKLQEAENYNLALKGDIRAEALATHRDAIRHFESLWDDSIKASKQQIMDQLEARFTTGITKDDEATLDNLSRVELSKAELELQFKKFKDNPFALRRLEEIAKEKDFTLPDFIQQEIDNTYGYDYYMGKLGDYMKTCQSTMRAYDNLDPEKELDEFTQITLDIYDKTLVDQTNVMVEIFSRVEGEA